MFSAFKVLLKQNVREGERGKVNTIKPMTSFFGVSLEIKSLVIPST